MSVYNSHDIFNRFGNLSDCYFQEQSPKARYLYVPGERNDRVVLVAHADTFWDDAYLPKINPAGIGADDRVGCAILWSLRNSGHSLLVTDGEEDGNQGAGLLANNNERLLSELNDGHQFMVEFDLRGADGFKCYDIGTPVFRQYIGSVTGYSDWGRSSATDICLLCRNICGVNISAGFHNEHCQAESIDGAEWLHTTAMAEAWLAQPLPKFSLDTEIVHIRNG